jgi:mRNA-decapping enzyme subunit 2
MNSTNEQCLLVRGYKSNAAWSFPRGKINLEESESDCAIREVFEETGYDFRSLLRPNDFIQCRVAQQVVTLYLVPGVREKTKFETQTRMEIGVS